MSKKDKEKSENEEKIEAKNETAEEQENLEVETAAEAEIKEEEKDNTLNQLKEENSKLKDEYLRKAAEFENYKRRTENDQVNLIKYAAEGFILNILPVFNDLERALAHANDEKTTESFQHGVKIVFDKFKKVLEDQGVQKMKSKGEPFDFNLHEALMQQPAKDVAPHTVLEEIEPGYLYKDKVIKHAKVIVSQELVDSSSEEKEENKD